MADDMKGWPQQKKTYVALVLDESGSMGGILNEARGLFNNQVREIKKSAQLGGATMVSLFKFGQDEKPGTCEVFHAQPADQVEEMKKGDYRAQGSTPMRDGIGRAITRLEAEDDGGADTAFLVVCVTDGLENASREWTSEAFRDKVSALQATGRWTFAVYGANISLADLIDHVGFAAAAMPFSNFVAYAATGQGVAGASANMRSATARYMNMREQGVTFSADFGNVTSNTNDDVNITTTNDEK